MPSGVTAVIDDWVALFATRDEMADEYADLLLTRPADWGVWPLLNVAIIDRWSLSGLEYIKRKAWKLAEEAGRDAG